MDITVYYNAVDGASNVRKFKTLAGASKYAVKMVGESPDFGSYYAVSADGIGKVQVKGCALKELFAKPAVGLAAYPFQVWYSVVVEGEGSRGEVMASAFKTLDAASAYVLEIEAYTDGVRIKPIGEEAEAEYEAAIMAEAERADREYDNAVWGAWRGVAL